MWKINDYLLFIYLFIIPVDWDVTVADDPAVGKYAVNFIREEQHEGSEKCRLLKHIFVYNVSIKFIVQYRTYLFKVTVPRLQVHRFIKIMW